MKVLNLFKICRKHTHIPIRQGYTRLLLLFFCGLSNTASYAAELKPLKLCSLHVFTEISNEQGQLAMASIFNRQLTDLGISVSFKLYKSGEEVLNGFDKGECDGMSTSPVEIIARKNQLDNLIFALADSADKGGKVYNYEIITNNMNANKLEDLEGKTIVYVTNRPFSKTYLEYSVLKLQHQDTNTFFRMVSEKKDPQTAIMEVFFGKADAAIVDHFSLEASKELNPQIGKKIKVILKSPPFYNVVIGIRSSEDAHFEIARKAFADNPERQLSLDKLETTFVKKDGRGLGFKLERLQKKDLAETEAIIKEIDTLKKTIK